MLIFEDIRFSFFFNDTATTEIYTLSLHDALPILNGRREQGREIGQRLHRPGLHLQIKRPGDSRPRSEEHTSELQSHSDLVCRLLLEKKKRSSERTVTRPATVDKRARSSMTQIANI